LTQYTSSEFLIESIITLLASSNSSKNVFHTNLACFCLYLSVILLSIGKSFLEDSYNTTLEILFSCNFEAKSKYLLFHHLRLQKVPCILINTFLFHLTGKVFIFISLSQ